jgi:very-short-patch-repair endonuclease
MRDYRNNLKIPSRDLRGSMTDAEQLLWTRLRRKQVHGVQFYRQKPLGPYIVDFFAPSAGLVVEVDGSQHTEADHFERDRVRDQCLAEEGLLVLRFNNREVLLETDAVLERIAEEILRRKSPSLGVTAKSPPAPLS